MSSQVPGSAIARAGIAGSIGNVTNPEAGTLYTVDEVAARLRVHPKTVRRLIARLELQSVRVGRTVRVRSGALDAYLSAATSPATPAERTAP